MSQWVIDSFRLEIAIVSPSFASLLLCKALQHFNTQKKPRFHLWVRIQVCSSLHVFKTLLMWPIDEMLVNRDSIVMGLLCLWKCFVYTHSIVWLKYQNTYFPYSRRELKFSGSKTNVVAATSGQIAPHRKYIYLALMLELELELEIAPYMRCCKDLNSKLRKSCSRIISQTSFC